LAPVASGICFGAAAGAAAAAGAVAELGRGVPAGAAVAHPSRASAAGTHIIPALLDRIIDDDDTAIARPATIRSRADLPARRGCMWFSSSGARLPMIDPP
jgi:hypothetical protein